MRIWIVSVFESTPIDNTRPMRFAGIADAALKRGHRITHFSCTFRHSTKHQRFDKTKIISVNSNFDLVFIHASAYKGNISWGRIRSHRMFTRNLIDFVCNEEKPDVILVTMPPMNSCAALTAWGKRNGVPVVLDIIDPWPDVFLRLVPTAFRSVFKALLAPMYRELKFILKNTSAVTGISNEYVNWAKSFKFDFAVTGVFYPAVKYGEIQSSLAKIKKRRDLLQSKKLTLIYAGNLASSYDIPTILKAAVIVERTFPGKTDFIICGVGPQSTIVEEHVRLHRNVTYLGRIGHHDLLKVYAVSDLGLTQHISGATQSITYKFFDYLGARLPILNSLQSEMASLIQENQVGLNNQAGNANELAENIAYFLTHPDQLERYKENAVAFTARFGDSDVVYRKLVQLLEDVEERNAALVDTHVSVGF